MASETISEDRADVLEALNSVPNFRSVPFIDVEMQDQGNEFSYDGIAAPIGQIADLGDFTEEYERRSFRSYLHGPGRNHNIPLCHEHDTTQLLGVTKSGRVVLEEDDRGLRTKARIVKTDLSERIKALVDSGDIAGMSIGMIVGKGNARVSQREGRIHRSITGFKRLLDVCTTYDPAYVSTEAQFRSAAAQLTASPDLLQQVLAGAYPQLGRGAVDLAVVEEAEEEVLETDSEDDGTKSQASDLSLEQRKRRLELFILEHGGN